jgi:hypothetical protein
LKKLIQILIFCAWSSSVTADLLIYGGSGHDEFLGNLNCGGYSTDSICNSYGTFGNSYSFQGMFNEYTGFGNKYNSSSPWNKYSSSNSVPVLVGKDGSFYDYFTINYYRSDAIDFSEDMYKLFEAVNGDLDKVREALCEAFS